MYKVARIKLVKPEKAVQIENYLIKVKKIPLFCERKF